MSRLQRCFAVLASSLTLIGGVAFTAGPAAAAVPGNDTQAGAVTISNSLPYHFTENTADATVDADDSVASSYCLGIGAPAYEHSVWFTATIPAGVTQAIRIDTSPSDYGTGIAVLADNGGTLSAISCSPRTFVSNGPPPAGNYVVVVFGDGTTPATSGNLDFTVDFVPPPPDIALTVNPTGTATKAGGAWISGTVTCTGGGANAEVFGVSGDVTQTVGRLIISSYYSSSQSIPCDGTTYLWQAYAPPTNGKFSGGKSATVNSAFGCGDGGCSSAYLEATVKLNRATIR